MSESSGSYEMEEVTNKRRKIEGSPNPDHTEQTCDQILFENIETLIAQLDEHRERLRKIVGNPNPHHAEQASDQIFSENIDTTNAEPYEHREWPIVRKIVRNPNPHRTEQASDRISSENIDTTNVELDEHQEWQKKRGKKRRKIHRRFEKICKMSIDIAEERVCFECHLEIEGKVLKYFTLQLTVDYSPDLCKWVFKRELCQAPRVVKFPEPNTYFNYPFCYGIIRVIKSMREQALEWFVKEHYFKFFMAKVQNDYPDINIHLNQDLDRMIVVLTGQAWPENLYRSSIKDFLTITLEFSGKKISHIEFTPLYYEKESLKGSWEENHKIVTERLAYSDSSTLDEVISKLMGRQLVGDRYKLNDLSQY